MADFLIDCYLNGFCKGIKNLVSTPRYARKLRIMWHSAELRLRAMRLNTYFNPLTRDQEGLIDEKTEGQKSREIVPLSHFLSREKDLGIVKT
jgi:hypothetical protein